MLNTGGADGLELVWNTCIQREYGCVLEYKYTHSKRIPRIQAGIHGKRAILRAVWKEYNPQLVLERRDIPRDSEPRRT